MTIMKLMRKYRIVFVTPCVNQAPALPVTAIVQLRVHRLLHDLICSHQDNMTLIKLKSITLFLSHLVYKYLHYLSQPMCKQMHHGTCHHAPVVWPTLEQCITFPFDCSIVMTHLYIWNNVRDCFNPVTINISMKKHETG